MDIAKDLMANLRDRFTPSGNAEPSDTLDWSELHARLSASHAAAGELARSCGVIAAGGFGLWQAAGSVPSRSVNPTGLADGKRAACMDGAIAGETSAGGRGQ